MYTKNSLNICMVYICCMEGCFTMKLIKNIALVLGLFVSSVHASPMDHFAYNFFTGSKLATVGGLYLVGATAYNYYKSDNTHDEKTVLGALQDTLKSKITWVVGLGLLSCYGYQKWQVYSGIFYPIKIELPPAHVREELYHLIPEKIWKSYEGKTLSRPYSLYDYKINNPKDENDLIEKLPYYWMWREDWHNGEISGDDYGRIIESIIYYVNAFYQKNN